MPPIVARIIAGLLIVVHLALAIWALVGFAEMSFTEVPWTRVSNPLFGPGMLALQWSLILIAAVAFISGYLSRWSRTPVAMAVIYGAMSLTCAWQTFFILEHDTRFREMGIEYAEYAIILLFLFFSAHARERFGRPARPVAG